MSNDLSTGRAKRKRSAKWIFLSAALIILGGLALFVFAAGDKAEADKLFTFECNSERVEFLNKQGLIVEPDPQREKITIPAEFNAAFTEYNELQKQQGFDLEPCCGKTVERCTYTVKNHPSGKVCQADLYICGGEIVAGDILCTGEGGFIAPLAFPKDA